MKRGLIIFKATQTSGIMLGCSWADSQELNAAEIQVLHAAYKV